MLKREVRIFVPKRETRVQFAPERDSCILTTQCEVRILLQTLQKHEVKTHIQSQMARIKVDPKSPHPLWFEASPLDIPIMDLRDYLTKKKSSQCCCEWLIITVLFECHCNSHTSKPVGIQSVVNCPNHKLSQETPLPQEEVILCVEYPGVTSIMVGPGTTPSKSKGKQLVICSGKSDDESSSGMKEILN